MGKWVSPNSAIRLLGLNPSLKKANSYLSRWVLEEFYRLEDVQHIRSLNKDMSLRRIYKRLKMEKPSPVEHEKRAGTGKPAAD
jgi:hypothetical protein